MPVSICPLGWDYRLEEGDSIIVLAEDNDTYKARGVADSARRTSARGLPR